MPTGRKVFAVITVVDGKPVIDLGNTAQYEVITSSEGVTCIVERKHKEFVTI
jgi:hypothetical protein